MKSYLKNNLGLQILLFYIFTHYIVQIGIHYLYYEDFALKYKSWNISPFYTLYSVILFLFFYLLVDLIIPDFRIKKIKIKNIIYLKYVFGIFFSLLFFIDALYFSLHFGLDFRQKHSLSEGGVLIQILVFQKYIFDFILFLFIIKIIKQDRIDFSDKIFLLFNLVCYSLTLTGSMEFLWIIIGIILIFFNSKKLSNFLVYKNIKIKDFIIYFLIFFVVVVIVLFIGLANKWGVERTEEIFLDPDKWNFLIKVLLMRITSSYFSLLFMAKEHIFDFYLQLKIYEYEFHTFLQRLSIATHLFDYRLPFVQTINHENYLLLFWDEYDRPGTTPGIIASTYYIFLFPFNFILMNMFLVIIFRILKNYLNYFKPNILGFILIFYGIYPLLQTPITLLVIIDPIFIYFILYILLVFFI